ncbi:MBL fold metallo-hydrolase [Actinorugispora endophytica]|uniref:MBL fold metallo-hydrolase n=1 Tax=Actinorugispora endophytica TaxID=1605990 RepID=UPI00105ED9FB|nr:MBL fold metallo-hydrolase [Actinorugispora endophytica]
MFWKRKANKKDVAEAGTASTAAEEAGEETAADGGETTGADAESAVAGTGAGSAETGGAGEKPGDAAGTEEAESEDGPGKAVAEDADDSRVQRIESPAVLEVDGEEHSVVTSTWIVQVDEDGVVVVNPGPDAKAVLEAVGDREIYLVACTNGYQPHIAGAVEVAERDESPIAVHPRELRRWRKVHGVEHNPEIEAEGGGTLTIGDFELEILPTPGTAPGSLSYYFADLGVVCSGDTLLAGELGTVGEGYMDYTTQLASVGEVLLALPEDTRVLPSQGEETTVGAESKNFDSWVSGD